MLINFCKLNLRLLIRNTQLHNGKLCLSNSTLKNCPAHDENFLPQSDAVSWENAQPMDKIPGPKKYPLIGMAPHFLPGGKYYNINMIELLKRAKKEYGDIVSLEMPTRGTMIMVFDPNDIEHVFRTEGKYPSRKGSETFSYYCRNLRQDLFKETCGLQAEEGERWYKIRSKANPIMLPPKVVRNYISPVDEIVCEFIERIKTIRDKDQYTPGNFLNELNKYAFEAIGLIALNTRLGVMKDLDKNSETQQYIQSLRDFFDLMFELEILPSIWKIIKTPKFVKMMKTLDIITNTTMKHVDAAIERIKKEGKSTDPDHIPSVLEQLYEIDRNVAVVIGIDMLMAGVETTGGTSATIMNFLAKNQDKQDKLRQEIMKILPDKDEKFTAQKMTNMPYLRACIKEALRIRPVIQSNLRATGQDIVIKGYRIPKGIDMIIPSNYLQMEEKYFNRSQEFIPERWLRSDNTEIIESAKIAHPFIYLPFGFGARTCIGKRFAELEIELLISRIVRNFIIEHDGELKYSQHLFNIPSEDIKFKLISIEN